MAAMAAAAVRLLPGGLVPYDLPACW